MRPRSPLQRAGSSALVATLSGFLAVAVTGCGQKGALYLPDRGGEVVTRPMQTPAADPAPEAPEAAGEESEPRASTPATEPPR